MDPVGLNSTEPANLSGVLWWAWMAAFAAGVILYGMVDDSPFVAAMQSNLAFRACWLGLEIGSVIAAGAIALGGAAVAWSMLRDALAAHRRDILWRLTFPVIAHLLLLAWMAAILIATGGNWAPSPWAVRFQQPGWPSEAFRWITGSISAAIWLGALAGSAISIVQALRLAESPAIARSLRFATRLAPVAAIGMLLVFVGVSVWGILASRYAPGAFRDSYGPLGLASSSTWAVSTILFAIAAIFSARAGWRSLAVRSRHE